jgi:hypothetical protein
MTQAEQPKPHKFVAIDRNVMRGKDEAIARAVTHNMAKRIANALNRYTPNAKGY